MLSAAVLRQAGVSPLDLCLGQIDFGPSRTGGPRFRWGAAIKKVATRHGNRAALNYARAILGHRARVTTAALRQAIIVGEIQAIETVVQAGLLGSNIERVMRAPLTGAVESGGIVTAELMQAEGIAVSFNVFQPNVVLFAREQSAKLVVGIHAETREVIRTVLAAGSRFGLTIDQQAMAIREVVGLTPNWAGAPVNLGNDIRNGNIGRATSRRLSAIDKQQIRSRILRGTVTEPFISEMQDKYAQRLINLRARVIARTESSRAAHHGQRESWRQARDEGKLPTTVRQFWITTPDTRLRATHAEVPGLNPDGVGLDDFFETPLGATEGPPLEPLCRCSVGIVLA